MRITRAAKVAAFPLIVLVLVALVACQGQSVFPARMARTGPGLPVIRVTEACPDSGARSVADADVFHIDEDTKGTVTVDLGMYFAGGVGDAADRTYAIVSTADVEGEVLEGTVSRSQRPLTYLVLS